MAKPKKQQNQRNRIDPKTFVKVWTLATSIDQVAAQLGVTKQTVYNTARRLRDKNVKLKDLTRREIDVEELNQIIDETERG